MKKASLNLSIQAIVIIVIAFVVLGLGLGFVKSTFGDITKTSEQVQAKIKEQILEDMRTSGKKLSITSQIQLERGKQVVESVGIVNTGLSTKKFGIKKTFLKKQNPDGSEDKSEAAGEEISFFYTERIEKELSPTTGDVIFVKISTRSGAAGNYLYKFDVFAEDLNQPGACGEDPVEGEGCELYDTRSFFVYVS